LSVKILGPEPFARSQTDESAAATVVTQQKWRALHWSGFSALVLYARLLPCQGVTGPDLML